jgi:aromatic-L-amino-acid/L-tryptophan decarboxylase
MLDRKHFRKDSQLVVRWIDQYLREIRKYPVKSMVRPGEIRSQIPVEMPEKGESLSSIMKDFEKIILPGITHWQHPNFHAYFNANSSTESILAEMLTAALGAQCMIWETSPAAAELEEMMLEWLKVACGLPAMWEGVIQDTASTATLVALITAREVCTGFTSNDAGVPLGLRIYCTGETHSSIEKAAGIAGIGRNNVVKVDTDGQRRMSPQALDRAITEDLEQGRTPCAAVLTLGTTGIMSIDNLDETGSVCKKHGIWLHVDAAYAGSALLLPEYRWMIDGIAHADSFVFNPHKWLFTNFDCTAYFVKDAGTLIRTFEILPEYLKTGSRGLVNDYRDWGIQLGRRFRALKLWFVLRSYGLQGLRERLRHHIRLTQYFIKWIESNPHLELVTAPVLNFCCFRYQPSGKDLPLAVVNQLNEQLLSRINQSGVAYLSHTRVDQKYVIRVVIGQTYVDQEDVERLIDLIERLVGEMSD